MISGGVGAATTIVVPLDGSVLAEIAVRPAVVASDAGSTVGVTSPHAGPRVGGHVVELGR